MKSYSRALLITLALIFMSLLSAACLDFSSQENPTDSTTASVSIPGTSQETTAIPDHSSTKSVDQETEVSTSEPPAEETTETTMPAPPPEEIFFQVLPANETITADLNGDGKDESLHYTCLDSYSFNLTINSETRRYEGEFFLADYFFLINLDNNNSTLDIAVQELGASDDYQVRFYYQEGQDIIERGRVPGRICDPDSETITEDPFGSGTIMIDGQGTVQGMARGQILHTWFYPELWFTGPDQLLRKEEQDIVNMYTFSSGGQDLASGNPVELRRDLVLYAEAGSSATVGIAETGEQAVLTRTDNQSWVQLRTENGLSGWFQVIDNFFISVEGEQIFADEVFSGLVFAD